MWPCAKCGQSRVDSEAACESCGWSPIASSDTSTSAAGAKSESTKYDNLIKSKRHDEPPVEHQPRSKVRDALLVVGLIIVGEAILLAVALAVGKEHFNLYGLLGFPFGVLFILNGLWDESPFVIPYFKTIQEERIGAEGIMLRMVGTGLVILVMSALAFFKILF